MLKRSHLVIGAVAIAAFALVACGRGDDAGQVATAPPVAQVTQPALAPSSTASPVAPRMQPVSQVVPTTEPTSPATPSSPTTVSSQPVQAPQQPTTTQQVPLETPSIDTADLSADQTVTVSDAVLTQVDRVLPTVEVVKILTPSIVQIVTETIGMSFSNQPVPSQGVGTGVVLDTEGHILTNNHVIAGGTSITVTLWNGESFSARVVGTDPTSDLAVVQIDAEGLSPARLGNSSELQVGEDVIAIGHALGLAGGPTVSKGVVSALDRSIDTDQSTTIVDLIQTDASINPGNSGGALVNNHAEVVGINTAIIQGSQGIGFAINIDDAKIVVSQLLEKGYVNRGFLGISPVNVTPGLARQLRLPVTEGVILARVIPGTAAAAAGLQVEDIIVQLGDESIINTGELSQFLLKHPPGETVRIVLFRNGTKITSTITLRERPN